MAGKADGKIRRDSGGIKALRSKKITEVKMKRLIFIIFFIVGPTALLAGANDPVVDPEKVKEILTGILGAGMGVIAITELLKRKLKTEGWESVVVSVIVSVLGTLAYLLMTSTFTWLGYAIYSTVVALAANGIYLFPQSRNK